MKRAQAILCVLVAAIASSGCLADIDNYFTSKRINRLAIARDDITPGKLVLFTNGVARSADHTLEVARSAQLTTKPFEAVLPAAMKSSAVDASLALKLVDAIVPLGVDGAVKLTGQVEISQTDVTGMRVDATQISELLKKQEGAPLRAWVLAYAKRKVQPFVVLETYSAKKVTLREKSGGDITAGLNVGATKVVTSGEAKVKITRTKSEELVLEGDKYYVFAVGVAAFDVTKGDTIEVGELGVDLSLPTPKVPVLGPETDPAKSFRPIGLAPSFEP